MKEMKRYKYIVFDVDGTLLDTEKAVLSSFKKTLEEECGIKKELSDLSFCLGITGLAALERIGIGNTEEVLEKWVRNLNGCSDQVRVFDGITQLLTRLKENGVMLGVVTSRVRGEYEKDMAAFGLSGFFETSVCVEDSITHKPDAGPMFRYMEQADAKPEEVLYIGDSIYDMECGKNAGVTCGLALWGCSSVRHIRADYYFPEPYDVLHTLDRQNALWEDKQWLSWAMELQFIAQAGLTYSKDGFDLERFQRIREIAAELMCGGTGMGMEKITTLFCNETGFQTPKLDTRSAIIENEKILLVREQNGLWSLPGGWVDVNQTVGNNAVKESQEEAGLDVVPVRLIALQDRNLHNIPLFAYGVCKVFLLCKVIGGEFEKNVETDASGWFGMEELPALDEDKNTKAQVEMCFAAYKNENWKPVFD